MKQKTPKAPSMADMLFQMSGCRVLTNTNGGNAYGNNKHKSRKDNSGNRKAHKRGANIDLGHRFKGDK